MEAAHTNHNIYPASEVWIDALIRIAEGDAEVYPDAVGCIPRISPLHVGEAHCIGLGILRHYYGERLDERKFTDLAQRIEREFTSPPVPPTVLDGLEEAPDTMRELLQTMAKLIDENAGDAPSAALVRKLAGFEVEHRLKQVLDQARDRLNEKMAR
jgi:hypothetical protein